MKTFIPVNEKNSRSSLTWMTLGCCEAMLKSLSLMLTKVTSGVSNLRPDFVKC